MKNISAKKVRSPLPLALVAVATILGVGLLTFVLWPRNESTGPELAGPERSGPVGGKPQDKLAPPADDSSPLPGKITLSKETTYLVEPLRPDGRRALSRAPCRETGTLPGARG